MCACMRVRVCARAQPRVLDRRQLEELQATLSEWAGNVNRTAAAFESSAAALLHA
jgi:hypothetical protein